MDIPTCRVLSLCSGVGGLDLGLKLAMPTSRTVAYMEIEAYACEILVKRMQEKILDPAPLWSDIKSFDGKPWRGKVDIITGGYPCQPFSVAGKKLGKKTPDISGPMCGELFPKLSQCSVSLKTSADIYSWASNKSTMTYKDWVTKLRQACSLRKKSVLRIAVSGSLSWPTVMTADATVAETITPNDKYVPTKNGTLRRYIKSGHNCSLGLARTARLWPTVLVSEANGASLKKVQTGYSRSRLKEEVLLWKQPQRWPTPRAQEPGSVSPNYTPGLKQVAINWRTPNASDAEGGVMEIRPGTSARIKLRDHSVHVANCLSGHPEPNDFDDWRNIPENLKPAVYRMADGLADRVDRVRACGNGVVPLVAAYAFTVLTSNLEFTTTGILNERES